MEQGKDKLKMTEKNTSDDFLKESWNSFSDARAKEYLKTFGHPSKTSKEILVKALENEFGSKKISIIDLGCGNAQLYEYFKERRLNCAYTGVDFSKPLLAAAKKANPEAEFIQSDINLLDNIKDVYDAAVYSHVIEMLPSPESSLVYISKIAEIIIIRFFEPPEFEFDTVELKMMETAEGLHVPYLRRKMSKDYYQMILKKIGREAKIIEDKNSKDQIHILKKIKTKKKWLLF